MGLDDQRRILFANHAAAQVLGLASPDLIGQPSQEVALHNDLMRHLVRDLFAPPPANAPASQEPLKIFANDRESYFSKEVLEVATTQDDQTQLVGYVILLKNITAYKELDAAKTNFIATISHELKTPIASIKMSLKLLGDERIGPLNPEQQQLLAHVDEDNERLLRITGELLDMAQVETGNIQLSKRATPAPDMVAHAQGALQVQAEQKQIKIMTEFAPGLPAVLADPDKTTWVLINLLSNAVRHSPEQSVIHIEALAWAPDGHDKIGLEVAPPFRVVPPAQLVAPQYVVLSVKDARASTRATCPGFLTVTTKCRAPPPKPAPAWGWPFPKSLSRPRAAASGSTANWAGAAVSHSCCRRGGRAKSGHLTNAEMTQWLQD